MAEFEKKTENKETSLEESPRLDKEKEKEMLTANLMEEKPKIEKSIPELTVPVLKIERGLDGQLVARTNGETIGVRVTRCFPWTQPTRYISLRDKDDNEVALIKSLDDLDDDSRRHVEVALAEIGFILEIEKITYMDEDFEIRVWKVETKHGPRSFQTKLDDWPRKLPGGGLLFRDVAGDLFYIRHPKELDEKSQKIIWAFLD